MKRSMFAAALFCLLVPAALVQADQDASETFLLRYKFSSGEVFRTKVTHLVAVETTIQGVTETAKTRSVSTKAWKIREVADNGNATFDYVIEEVSMWNQMYGRQ